MNQKTKKRYILFGHGRSGSHLIGDYINQHPDAYFDDELFNFFRLAKLSFWKRWIVKKLPHVYFNRRIRYTQKEVYGFSFIIYQFKIARTSLREMHENGWKIIYLNRTDLFDQMISHQVAFKKNNWHNIKTQETEKAEQSEFFELDLEMCIKSLKDTQDIRESEKKLLKGLPHFSVNYERDIQVSTRHQETLDGVFDYLGLPSFVLKPPKYQKVFSKPYNEIVLNYSVIRNTAISEGLIKF